MMKRGEIKRSEMPLAPFERILRQAGGQRVSDEAVEELRKIVENFARDIARTAVEMSRHAKRITIKSADIDLALKVTISKWAATESIMEKYK